MLVSAREASLGDSQFPTYAAKNQTTGAKIIFFQSLYKEYCALQLSQSTDRPFAIAGLEQRFTRALEVTSGAGTFGGQFLGRSLLWRRPDDLDKMKRINFQVPRYLSQMVHQPPSWSFMAYMGAISYIETPGNTVKWEQLDVHLTGTAEGSWLYAPEPLIFKAQALDFEPNALPYSGDWLIAYDDHTVDQTKDKCIILGKTADEDGVRYILVVRPKGANGKNGKPLYERGGAGYVPFGWIKDTSIDVEVV